MPSKKLNIVVAVKDKASKPLGKIGEKFPKLTKGAMVAAPAIAAVGAAALTAGTAMFALAKKTADLGDKYQKLSKNTGVAVEDLSALAHAAKLSGSNIDVLGKGFQTLNQRAVDAGRGLKSAAIEFEELGVNVKDAEGNTRETIDIFYDLADAMEGMGSEAEKSAAAQRLFGRAGKELIPLLNEGADGIREMMEEAERLGIVFDQEAADNAAKFNDEITRLEAQFDGLQIALGNELIPMLTELVEDLQDVAQWVKDNSDAIEGYIGWVVELNKRFNPLVLILDKVAAAWGRVFDGIEDARRAYHNWVTDTTGDAPSALASIPQVAFKKTNKTTTTSGGGGGGGGGGGSKESKFDPMQFENARLQAEKDAYLQRINAQIEFQNRQVEIQQEYDEYVKQREQEQLDERLDMYKEWGNAVSDANAEVIDAIVSGSEKGGQAAIKAYGKMLGKKARMEGLEKMAHGAAEIFEGIATDKPTKITGGTGMIVKGAALVALGAKLGAMGGGGSSGGGGGGGGGRGGGGRGRAIPGEGTMVPDERRRLRATVVVPSQGIIVSPLEFLKNAFQEFGKGQDMDMDVTFVQSNVTG